MAYTRAYTQVPKLYSKTPSACSGDDDGIHFCQSYITYLVSSSSTYYIGSDDKDVEFVFDFEEEVSIDYIQVQNWGSSYFNVFIESAFDTDNWDSFTTSWKSHQTPDKKRELQVSKQKSKALASIRKSEIQGHAIFAGKVGHFKIVF